MFDKDLKRIGATDADFLALITDLTNNPEASAKIQGLKGVRKIRFAISSRRIGKSGGGRAIYLALKMDQSIILITAYTKNEKTDLSTQQRQQILSLLKEIKDE
jgi:hypothetical protein